MWTGSTNFILFKRNEWLKTLLLMLWVKNRRAIWSQSVVGRTNGFSHEAGVLTHGQVHLLLSLLLSLPKRPGERVRESLPSCIVDANLRVLNLVIVKQGERDIPR
jgi:hypothetical protein